MLKKPRKHVKEYWDFDEICHYLEEKHSVDLRDYAGKFSGEHSFDAWCDKKGYGQIDPVGRQRGCSSIWYEKFNADVAEGIWVEAPYLDFWHWLTHNLDASRQRFFTLPVDYFKNIKVEEDQKWLVEILEMFKEFADEKGEIYCYIS